MSSITIPAARVQQGSLSLFATAIQVRHLITPGFYSVDTLDPEDSSKGFQRLLNVARARKLADYIVAGQDSKDAFLPTSVFLATDKTLYINDSNNTLMIDSTAIGPFSVVDGQHRLEGLKEAARRDNRVLDFEIPVNIATNLTKIAQMCHFLIVNTTQKSVDKAVEQRIIARLTEALDFEDVPSLPKWILRTVQKGEVDKAIKLVDYLNTTEDSVWYSRIQMANTDGSNSTINQGSFVKIAIKYVFTANNPLLAFKDFEREKKAFSNYWKAISEILDDGEPSTLYKYNGVDLFCRFSIPFFTRMMERQNFTVNAMKEALESCFENLDGQYAGAGHPDFWATGGTAGQLNASALGEIVKEMAITLHKSGRGGEIAL